MTLRTFSGFCFASAIILTTTVPALAQDGLIDEVRLGALGSIEKDAEDGAFVHGMVFADPFGHDTAQGWEKLALPRLHLGGEVSTRGEANQIYAGFSWTADLTDRMFLEAGFGGAIHDGTLDEDGTPGPKLGCRALFHEYVAAGFNLDSHWRVVANVGHSSHANLCDGPNNGLSRAGVQIGYKF